ncbi:hypothetical protein UCREL1_4176 [Eutypa lata UCREL1]|uniref:Uncharacterized protein n=1 Tax=Eutypa lata (strain UCR-EL1) TaxID=1287681 RepID=M7SQP8_EUTLA|nr:hypothetical protein UCREL1_4176 [Eutypa lata UCREL1]
MPMPTVSPLGANDSFAPDSEMPSFPFNEFEFFDADDSQNTTPNPDFIDLHAGNPLHFADPKALIGNPPGQITEAKIFDSVDERIEDERLKRSFPYLEPYR